MRGRDLERISFFAVCLGLPLALYGFFVVSPILQAFYYSLTDWSGYDANPGFIGLGNYVALLHDPSSGRPCATTSCSPSCCRS